jgi:23S rRNA G2445 N2-methylase RlmL
MKGFVVTNKGVEEISKLEISELIDVFPEIDETVIKFPIKDYFDLCTVCYKSQSINKAALLLCEFEVFKSIEETISKIKISKLFDDWKSKKIRVDCIREGQHGFNSIDLASKISKILINKCGGKVDFDNPDVIFFVYVYNKKGYLGIDFSGIELGKRQYKIFHHPESLKGITGYYLVRKSGFTGKETFIDPFMGSGIIVIEAALFASNFPVQYYNKSKLAFFHYDFFKKSGKDFFEIHDKKIKDIKTKIYGYDSQLRYLKAVQKNAKLAGISKSINASKVDVEWLDTKFEKNSVDLIVSDVPRFGKNKEVTKLEKTYDEFFYQADFVLKKKSKLIILAKDYVILEKCAKKHKFKINKKYLLNQGKEQFNVLVFQKVG